MILIITSTFLIGCSQKYFRKMIIKICKFYGKAFMVHFIDVGQADSILIEQGNSTMLIDAEIMMMEKSLKDYLK